MRFMNITPLFPEQKDEVCQDLDRMFRQGIISEAAFMFKINPEGSPPVDKIAIFAPKFRAMCDTLRAINPAIPAGILLQSTMGHGWVQDSPPDSMQKMANAANKETLTRIICPLDQHFRDYIRKSVQDAMRLQPAFIMVDDDFRLFTGRDGCFCPAHIARFNAENGLAYDKEGLIAAIKQDKDLSLRYESFCADTITELAAIIREAIDSVDPSVPGSFCACGSDIKYAERQARALAGPNHPAIVRINNGYYNQDSTRQFPQRMFHTACSIAVLQGVEEILSEPDTCPHNQYSTPATMLNCHMAGSILEGCNGSKFWITALRSWEPESGDAYRKILAQYQGFYHELERLRKQLRFVGTAIPLPGSAVQQQERIYDGQSLDSYQCFVHPFGRMGIPCNFTRDPAGLPVLLAGPQVPQFSDDELLAFFRAGMLIDGEAAEALDRRGFARYTGVTAGPFPDVKATWELLGQDRLRAQPGDTLRLLRPLNDRVDVITTLVNSVSSASDDCTPIAPGTTRFRNELGGTIVALAGSARTRETFGDFAFFSQSRKKLLLELFASIGPQPVSYPGTYELFTKAFTADGQLYFSIINLGRDELDDLPLDLMTTLTSIQTLTPDGQWQDLQWQQDDNNRVRVTTTLRATTPYLLRFA